MNTILQVKYVALFYWPEVEVHMFLQDKILINFVLYHLQGSEVKVFLHEEKFINFVLYQVEVISPHDNIDRLNFVFCYLPAVGFKILYQ